MSDRRDELPPPPELADDERDPDPEEPESEEVEYFVEVEEVSVVLTSVPKEAHWSHTSSSAPSTLTVFGDGVSLPHISH
jgi:hypothetical protein